MIEDITMRLLVLLKIISVLVTTLFSFVIGGILVSSVVIRETHWYLKIINLILAYFAYYAFLLCIGILLTC